MREHPILFSTPMVQALLAGRKTQTRRTIKQPKGSYGFYIASKSDTGEVTGVYAHDENERACKPGTDDEWPIHCPYGKPGDILWVRETFTPIFNGDGGFLYRADPPFDGMAKGDFGWNWKPSIHMPKDAARIWLQVESVRVERAQDISEEDAIAEGVQEAGCDNATMLTCPSLTCKEQGCSGKDTYFRYPVDFDGEPAYGAIESFESLWHSINGRESWDANPWVWVVSFKVLSTTGRP